MSSNVLNLTTLVLVFGLLAVLSNSSPLHNKAITALAEYDAENSKEGIGLDNDYFNTLDDIYPELSEEAVEYAEGSQDYGEYEGDYDYTTSGYDYNDYVNAGDEGSSDYNYYDYEGSEDAGSADYNYYDYAGNGDVASADYNYYYYADSGDYAADYDEDCAEEEDDYAGYEYSSEDDDCDGSDESPEDTFSERPPVATVARRSPRQADVQRDGLHLAQRRKPGTRAHPVKPLPKKGAPKPPKNLKRTSKKGTAKRQDNRSTKPKRPTVVKRQPTPKKAPKHHKKPTAKDQNIQRKGNRLGQTKPLVVGKRADSVRGKKGQTKAGRAKDKRQAPSRPKAAKKENARKNEQHPARH